MLARIAVTPAESINCEPASKELERGAPTGKGNGNYRHAHAHKKRQSKQ